MILEIKKSLTVLLWSVDEQVDSLYFHHPKSRIDISQESRLKLTSQEVAEWKQELGTGHVHHNNMYEFGF